MSVRVRRRSVGLLMRSTGYGRMGRVAALLAAGMMLCASASWGQESSRVCVARADRVVFPDSVFTPSWVYPEGKIDYFVVEALLDQAVGSLTGESSVRTAWSQLFRPNDRVGVQIDVGALPVHQALIEAPRWRRDTGDGQRF